MTYTDEAEKMGVQIISDYRLSDGSHIILGKRSRPVFPNASYVTWGTDLEGCYLHTGHYDLDEAEGHADFTRRVAREY